MNYPGSKQAGGSVQQIIRHVPACKIFIDAMAGSAVVGNYVRSLVDLVVTNDCDRSLQTDTHLDYRDLVDQCDCTAGHGIFFYFDPPYLKSTRRSKRRLYKHDWNDNDHNEFLTRATAVQSNCMISHYPCELYDNALQSWRTTTYRSMTRAGWATEKLYMNYLEPQLLLTTAAGGNNRTERQAQKRKVNRLLAKFRNLSVEERTILLTAINQEYHLR